MGFLGKILKGIQFVMPLVLGIEPMFGAGKGEDKQAAVIQAVGAIIAVSEAITQMEIADEEKFQEGLKEVIDGTVKMLNASLWKK